MGFTLLLVILLIFLAVIAFGGAAYGRRSGWYGTYQPGEPPFGTGPGPGEPTAPPGSGAPGAPPTVNPASFGWGADGDAYGRAYWPWRRPRQHNWGYYHTGVIGIVLVAIIVVILVGYVAY